MISRRILLFILLISATLPLLAQFRVQGRVIDSVTLSPLAFVNIIVNDSQYGGLTDIDGEFSFSLPFQVHSLTLSYVGYKQKTVQVAGKSDLKIDLLRVNYELSEVVVVPGENPAHRIIRRVIENREANNPEKNLHTFRYKSYNKTTAEWYFDESRITKYQDNGDSAKADSLYINLLKQSEEHSILMMESCTERIYMTPAHSLETVLATRISGFMDPAFASLATDIQPFTFYDDLITLNLTDVKDYLNPVGNGSIGRYSYIIEDTLYHGTDSIYVISYHPLRGKTFNGLKGLLYINTNGYALQNVIAEPADEGLWTIKIQQEYELIDGKQWFPVKLNYDWILPKYPSPKVGMVMHGRSYFSNIELNPLLSGKDFIPEKIVMDKNAATRDEIYWNQRRADTLSVRERKTYVVVDSMGKKMNFDYLVRLSSEILEGNLPVGPVSIIADRLYSSNAIEGNRLGFGLMTNNKMAKWVSVGGYFGYGTKDRRWKYGGNAVFTLSHNQEIKLKFAYANDLWAAGQSRLPGIGGSAYWTGYINTRLDRGEQKSASVSFRCFRYGEFNVSLSQQRLHPEYNFTWSGSGDTLNGNIFDFTEARIGAKYSFRDNLVDAFDKKVSLGSMYPVLYFSYSRGITGILKGKFRYDKFEMALEKRIRIRNVGLMSFLVEGGYIMGDVPYMKLFAARGTYDRDFPALIKNSFQTMRPGEFTSSRYASLFVSHNFGSLLFKVKKFNPEISLVQGVLFGDIKAGKKYNGISVAAPDKGFFEAGLVIDNLIKIKLLNIVYLGLGCGAYYRYGYYSFNKPIDNAAFKISLKLGST
ncbi:MAG: DUF5686 family protein [Bacteroidota bacterium]